MNYPTMQKKVYEFTLKHALKGADKALLSEIKEEIRNDTFWTPVFDEIQYSLDRCYDIDTVVGEVDYAVEEIAYAIKDYYSNSMNFAPRGELFELSVVERIDDDIIYEFAEKLING